MKCKYSDTLANLGKTLKRATTSPGRQGLLAPHTPLQDQSFGLAFVTLGVAIPGAILAASGGVTVAGAEISKSQINRQAKRCKLSLLK